jgi:hypothetical protein
VNGGEDTLAGPWSDLFRTAQRSGDRSDTYA